MSFFEKLLELFAGKSSDTSVSVATAVPGATDATAVPGTIETTGNPATAVATAVPVAIAVPVTPINDIDNQLQTFRTNTNDNAKEKDNLFMKHQPAVKTMVAVSAAATLGTVMKENPVILATLGVGVVGTGAMCMGGITAIFIVISWAIEKKIQLDKMKMTLEESMLQLMQNHKLFRLIMKINLIFEFKMDGLIINNLNQKIHLALVYSLSLFNKRQLEGLLCYLEGTTGTDECKLSPTDLQKLAVVKANAQTKVTDLVKNAQENANVLANNARGKIDRSLTSVTELAKSAPGKATDFAIRTRDATNKQIASAKDSALDTASVLKKLPSTNTLAETVKNSSANASAQLASATGLANSALDTIGKSKEQLSSVRNRAQSTANDLKQKLQSSSAFTDSAKNVQKNATDLATTARDLFASKLGRISGGAVEATDTSNLLVAIIERELKLRSGGFLNLSTKDKLTRGTASFMKIFKSPVFRNEMIANLTIVNGLMGDIQSKCMIQLVAYTSNPNFRKLVADLQESDEYKSYITETINIPNTNYKYEKDVMNEIIEKVETVKIIAIEAEDITEKEKGGTAKKRNSIRRKRRTTRRVM